MEIVFQFLIGKSETKHKHHRRKYYRSMFQFLIGKSETNPRPGDVGSRFLSFNSS